MQIDSINVGLIVYDTGEPRAFFANVAGLGLTNVRFALKLPSGATCTLADGDDELKSFYDIGDLSQYRNGEYQVVATLPDGRTEHHKAILSGTDTIDSCAGHLQMLNRFNASRRNSTAVAVEFPQESPVPDDSGCESEVEILVRLDPPTINGYRPVKRMLAEPGVATVSILDLDPNQDYEVYLVRSLIGAGGREGKMTAAIVEATPPKTVSRITQS